MPRSSQPRLRSFKKLFNIDRLTIVTIKPHAPKTPSGQVVKLYPGGSIQIIGIDFKSLVRIALNRPSCAISGDGVSLEKVNCDVEAVPPENKPASMINLRHSGTRSTTSGLPQMLTALLVDRFQIKFHRETKTETIYLHKRSDKPLPFVASEQERKNERRSHHSPGFGSIELCGNGDLSDGARGRILLRARRKTRV